MSASFQERSAWIMLASMIAVFGIYFVIVARMLTAGVDIVPPFVPLFAALTVVLVVLQVIGHTAAAILNRPERRDERDRLIAWRSESNSSWILGAGVLLAAFAMATPVAPGWVANGLLLSLVLAEVVNYACRVYYYRRGV